MNWTETAARLLRERAGLAFAPNQMRRLETGARRAMARAGLDDPDAYVARLTAGALELDPLLDEVVVGETYFFRDPGQLDFVRRLVRASRRPLRIWSAGCATGEEVYTLAILLEQEGRADGAVVLGTDVSRRALAQARAGLYRDWSMRALDPAEAGRWLRRVGDGWEVPERLRRRVRFEHLNLALDVFPSMVTGVWGMDLILCRNVMIYFDAPSIAALSRRLRATLADDGWLITGAADPPLDGFDTVTTEAGLVYRRGAPIPKAPEPVEEAPIVIPEPIAAPTIETPDPIASIRGLADAEGSAAAVHAIDPRAPRADLQFLRAVLLIDLGLADAAVGALRRALYLDPSLAVAHLTLGSTLRRRGDGDGARRAYRNARDLLGAMPPDAPVPMADGERAGRLVEAARFELEMP